MMMNESLAGTLCTTLIPFVKVDLVNRTVPSFVRTISCSPTSGNVWFLIRKLRKLWLNWWITQQPRWRYLSSMKSVKLFSSWELKRLLGHKYWQNNSATSLLKRNAIRCTSFLFFLQYYWRNCNNMLCTKHTILLLYNNWHK